MKSLLSPVPLECRKRWIRRALREESSAEKRSAVMLVGTGASERLRIGKKLERRNFQVMTADCAAEALDIYRFVGSRLSLVLVDRHLRGDDPFALFIAFYRMDPKLKMVVIR
jgi:ActR/RegA family two-component response regulator